MTRIYRILAIALIFIGLIVVAKTIQGSVTDALNVKTNPIYCDAKGCRTIQKDGTLADDSLPRPESPR